MSDAKRKKQPGQPKKARAKIKLDDLDIRKETLKQLSGGEAGDVKGGMRQSGDSDPGTTCSTCRSHTCYGVGLHC